MALHSHLLELETSPPSPTAHFLLWTIFAAISIFVAWSTLGRLDVVVVAPGRVIATGGTKTIQTEELSVVKAVRVTEGAAVRSGDVLVELDPTLKKADLDASLEKGAELKADIARMRAELSGKASAMAAETRPGEGDIFAARNAAYASRRMAAQSDLDSKAHSRHVDEEQLAKLSYLQTSASERVRQASTVLGTSISLADYSKLQETAISAEHDLSAQEERLKADEATERAARGAFQELEDDRRQQLVTDIQDKSNALAALGPEQTKARLSIQRKIVVAPVNGFVQDVAVATVGGVVSPAQVLMTIVPAASDTEVEALLNNEDVGHVKQGQRVEVKLDAFPSGKFGVIEGTVINVSKDVMDKDRVQSIASREAASRDPVYRVRVRLARQYVQKQSSKYYVQTGMSVSLAIEVERRAIYEYFLAPFNDALDRTQAAI